MSTRFLVRIAPIWACLLFACIGDLDCGYEPFRMQADPIHLEALSSPYDDWNCGEPDLPSAFSRSFLFSSNRGDAGGQFDLIPDVLLVEGRDTIRNRAWGSLEPWITRLAKAVNTPEDELGPSFWIRHRAGIHSVPGALVFSRGPRQNHDLRALLPVDGDLSDWVDTALLPERALDPLNTPADEGYPTWDPDWDRIFFHSNRGGKYRIYQALVPMNPAGPFAWLADPTVGEVKVSEVPSLQAGDGEERCPFLRGDTLYFVSDRSGGLGGFDIYRSVRKASSWTEPENLGPSVNSSADEYRPHPLRLVEYGEALLFSSNRPGGLGGYDLYLAGLARKPPPAPPIPPR